MVTLLQPSVSMSYSEKWSTKTTGWSIYRTYKKGIFLANFKNFPLKITIVHFLINWKFAKIWCQTFIKIWRNSKSNYLSTWFMDNPIGKKEGSFYYTTCKYNILPYEGREREDLHSSQLIQDYEFLIICYQG